MKLQLRALGVVIGLLCATTGFTQATVPAAKASASTNSAPVPATAGSKKGAPSNASTGSPMTEAVGGGDGKVWVNTKSKTYHCAGTKYYGKTKVGAYMTEVDAKAKGNHADHGKVCAK